MAVPRKKTTPSKRGKRRSGHRLHLPHPVEDKETGELRLSHHIAPKAGTYRGRQIIQRPEQTPEQAES